MPLKKTHMSTLFLFIQRFSDRSGKERDLKAERNLLVAQFCMSCGKAPLRTSPTMPFHSDVNGISFFLLITCPCWLNDLMPQEVQHVREDVFYLLHFQLCSFGGLRSRWSKGGGGSVEPVP